MAYRDMKNVIDSAASEGETKGIAIGLAKGHAEGRVEGQVEKAQEIARRLLQKNTPLAEIADLTGLSKAEIKSLAP